MKKWLGECVGYRPTYKDFNDDFADIEHVHIDFQQIVYRALDNLVRKREAQTKMEQKTEMAEERKIPEEWKGLLLESTLDPQFVEDLYNEILEFLKYILKLTRPSEYIIISQDGITPRARMNYTKRKSWYHLVSKHGLNGNHGIGCVEKYDEYKGVFNYGTVHAAEIMKRTEEFLKEYCAKHKCHYILNSGRYVEEGDFKIARYLQKNEQTLINHNIAISSMDNDLLLLALMSPIQNICVVMPSYDVKRDRQNITVFSLPEIRQRLSSYIKRTIGEEYDMTTGFYQDLILIEVLHDDSYVPHLYQNMTQKSAGSYQSFTDLNFVYLIYFKKFKAHLTNNEEIIWQNLVEYLKLLNENKPYNPQKRIETVSPITKETTYNVLRKYISEEKLNSLEQEFGPVALAKFVEYIYGLQYSMDTYFKGSPSWEWSYHFYEGLTVQDFIKIYEAIGITEYKFEFEKGSPFDSQFKKMVYMYGPNRYYLIPKPFQAFYQYAKSRNNKYLEELFNENVEQDVLRAESVFIITPEHERAFEEAFQAFKIEYQEEISKLSEDEKDRDISVSDLSYILNVKPMKTFDKYFLDDLKFKPRSHHKEHHKKGYNHKKYHDNHDKSKHYDKKNSYDKHHKEKDNEYDEKDKKNKDKSPSYEDNDQEENSKPRKMITK